MDGENSTLLPHILQTLSEKPQLCDTYENLYNELKYVLSDENLNKIAENIVHALNVGQSLGILTLTDDLVQMPFDYTKGTANKSKKSPTGKKPAKMASTLKKVMESSSAAEIEQFPREQPRRIHVMPAIRELLGGRRKRGARRRSRTRRRSRSRTSRRRSKRR